MAAIVKSPMTSKSLEQAIARLNAARTSPARQAFATRVVDALANIAVEIDEPTLLRAVGADSEYDVLLSMLSTPTALGALRKEDVLAPARLLGLRQQHELLYVEGGTLSSTDAAEILGITRQAVNKRRRAGKLIGVSLGKRGYAYPVWQFEAGRGTLAGLEDVLEALSEFGPWTQFAFMVGGNLRLEGETPLACLRRGEVEPVVRAASAYGEHGAA